MSRGRELLRPLLGWLLAAAGLVWVFHDVDGAELRRDLTGVRWLWILPAVGADVLSYVCQGARWSLLLRPLGRLSVRRATQAIYAGLFTNELLPMRAGEVVRSYLVSRWTGAPIAAVVSSIALERLFDGFWLAVACGVSALAVPLPRDLARAADGLGIVVLAAAVALVVIARRPPRTAAAAGPVGRLLRRLHQDLHALARARGFWLAGLISAPVLICQALAFWLVMVAYGLPLSVWSGTIALLIVHLGTALPNAPGNVGSYQFFCVVALALFGIEKTRASGFSLVVFVVLTAPLLIVGSWAWRRSGLDLRRVRREAGAWLSRSPQGPPGPSA